MRDGISADWLAELKSKNNIVEVVSQYCSVNKHGGLYKACCPFHMEKTPSFVIYEDEARYHCFGCGKSGDVINFIRDEENLTFMEAVTYLANRVGMTVPSVEFTPETKKKREESAIICDILRDAAKYYHANLVGKPEAKEARQYLADRGITKEVIDRYGIGYSLDYDKLPAFLRIKEYPESLLVKSGIITERMSDFLAYRIIVPIINTYDNVVGFGGRVVGKAPEGQAKYKNLTNTPVFSKRTLLYGLNFVKKLKRTSEVSLIILVEGYMDVISLGKEGIANVVAGMGTALTVEQAKELSRWCRRVIVCYDGDAAGKKATLAAIETLSDAGLDVSVIALPDGLDPDEYVGKYGKDGFLKLAENACERVEYRLGLVESRVDMNTPAGRAAYIRESLAYLSTLKDITEREVYLSVVAEKSNVSVDTLKRQMNGLLAGIREKVAKDESFAAARAENQNSEPKAIVDAAEYVLSSLVKNRQFAVLSELRDAWLFTSVQHSVFSYLSECEKNDARAVAGNLYDVVGESEELSHIINVDVDMSSEIMAARYFEDSLIALANNYLAKEIKKVTAIFNRSDIPREEQLAALQKLKELQIAANSKKLEDKYVG